jgi:undecaprenyl-diphosphatase
LQFLRQSFRKLARVEAALLLSVFAVGGLLLAFGLLAEEVMEGGTAAFDRHIILAFRSSENSMPVGPLWVQEMARDITSLGSFAVLGILVLIATGYLFLTRKPAAAWLLLSAVLGGVVLNTLLKLVFARPRPDFIAPAARVFTPSFPSGHAALSAITFLTLASLLARTTDDRATRIFCIAVGIVLTLMVGISRIYLGVHYPTDVFAGWCLGSAWALTCWLVMRQLQHEGRVEAPEPASDTNQIVGRKTQ